MSSLGGNRVCLRWGEIEFVLGGSGRGFLHLRPSMPPVLAILQGIESTDMAHALNHHLRSLAELNIKRAHNGCRDKGMLQLARIELVHAVIALVDGSREDVCQRTKVGLQNLHDHAVGCNQTLGHAYNVRAADQTRHAIGGIVMVSMGDVLEDAEVAAACFAHLVHILLRHRTATILLEDCLGKLICRSVDGVRVDAVLNLHCGACSRAPSKPKTLYQRMFRQQLGNLSPRFPAFVLATAAAHQPSDLLDLRSTAGLLQLLQAADKGSNI